MKSKSKRADKELNKSHKSSVGDRKLFYNSIFVDGSTVPALGVHKKSKKSSRNVSVKEKRVKTRKDNFAVKNCTPDTTEIRSVGTITSQDHQSKVIHKVTKNDINVNKAFVEESSNDTSESVFAPGNAVLLCEDLSTTCQEAMVNATIEEEGMSAKKNAAVLTDPECLGPCDPGSSVVLEGIVWNESRNGLLVVNVTWRGKTYVGTLMDSSNQHWGSPCFKDGSWNLETKEDEVEGRRLRRNRMCSQKLLRSSDTSQHPGLAFQDESSTGSKEFACTIPSCSKRFKSLSGLKTHKCVALRENSFNAKSLCDAVPTCPSADKSLQTNQKASKMNGRNKQGTLKRRNHLEHLCNGNETTHIQLNAKCKTKFPDTCTFGSSNDSHVTSKHKSNRDATKSLNHKRGEKQKKSAKPQRKKKIKGISPLSNNSSACRSNAFSNEFESNIISKNIHSNGPIRTSECASACKSVDTCSMKDVSKDNFLHLFDANHKQHENMLTLKSKSFFTNSHHPYSGIRFGTTTCSSPSHIGSNCSKCSLPQSELQGFESLKTPISRPTLMSLNKTPATEPSTASTMVPCKASDDIYNTPLEANTASEVFTQDSKHYRQAGSGHVGDYLFSKKQAT